MTLGRISRDLVAGVTVAIVALPLALAFGAAAGVGPAAGLVTAIVAGIVAALFGGSRVQVSGPTGAMVVVLAPIVADHGVQSVALVSCLAGVILIVAGFLRLGRVVGVIPWPVIEGFTLGIAVTIAAQQIPATVDVEGAIGTNAVGEAATSLAEMGPHARWGVGVALASVVIMVGARKINRRLPDSLIAVAVVTLAAEVWSAPIRRIGALPEGLPTPTVPPVDEPSVLVTLLPAALAVAALSAIESLLSARVANGMADVGPMHPDRELGGQGLASIAAGLFGGMPATGAIARTAVNVSSGGRTRLAAVSHSIVLLVITLVAASLVSRIPLAALSGVLFVVSFRMVDWGAVKDITRIGRSTLFVFMMTAIVTIAFDLVIAVLIGVVVAAFFVLRQVSRSSGIRREPLPGTPERADDRIVLLTLTGPVFFAATDQLAVEGIDLSDAEVVIIRLSQLTMIDASGARAITELRRWLERRGIAVLFKGVRDVDSRTLWRAGAIEPESATFDSLDDAVDTARALVSSTDQLPPQFRSRRR